jgi:hypothetical protein
MTITRLYICLAMGRFAQYIRKPAIHYGHTEKRVMRYLRSSIKQKLHYAVGNGQEEHLAGYRDADWVSDTSD